MLSRRRFLRRAGLGAAALGSAANPALAVTLAGRGPSKTTPGSEPSGLPERQFAWTETLAKDTYGNPVAPMYDRLLFFDVRAGLTPAAAGTLEAALRTLERTFAWGPDGLLFTVAWGPHYFEKVLGLTSPIPHPEVLSTFEAPILDSYDMCLHLASDDEQRLEAIEAALVHGSALPGTHGPLPITGPLRWRETQTGFVGEGLPAQQRRVAGIPAGNPVPATSPLFMGFKSGLIKNQASEDAVTIPDGPFAGGTTMHVSYMHLNLQFWYDRNTDLQRVRGMSAAQVTPAEIPEIATELATHADQIEQAIIDYGVDRPLPDLRRARRDGKPIIIRRDFDTIDRGHAGLHFVSIQRTIDDFVTPAGR